MEEVQFILEFRGEDEHINSVGRTKKGGQWKWQKSSGDSLHNRKHITKTEAGGDAETTQGSSIQC